MTRLVCPFCRCCARYGCEIDGDSVGCDRLDTTDDAPCPCTRAEESEKGEDLP
ncbi:hypothetical protein ABT352_15655 [Streptosporangium sp. NPDC000563]|uniref:hypothetical protein n=1 Tax=unclassified Streptosporangium TaxID=2632669 RepID=UPI003324D2ED